MSKATPTDLTAILNQVNHGDDAAVTRLLSVVYDELRRLADAKMRRERKDHTLQPTALVHEAYMRLLGSADSVWENRGHFFAAAAESMRRILVDHARAKCARKRGGSQQKVSLDAAINLSEEGSEEVVAVDDALKKLAESSPQKSKVVELRFFGGLTVEETADVLNISPRTVKRDWAFARAWLFREVSGEPA